MPNREKAMGASELVQAIRSRNKDKWSLSRVAATRLVQANYDMRTAQRDRALEAVEKLRGALGDISKRGTHRSLPYRSLDGGHIFPAETKKTAWALIADEALAATEPATVELQKCDRCGASENACRTECDGSSHYTPEKKE